MSKTSQRKLAHEQNKLRWYKKGRRRFIDGNYIHGGIPRQYWKHFCKGYNDAMKELESKVDIEGYEDL